MEKFLESVARYFIGRSSDHRGTTLVFPNKRSSIFMRRYFKRNARGPIFIPRMVTMGSFMGKFSDDVVEADRLEQLFTLYDAYIEVENSIGQTPRSFDSFRFWGEMMLDDFDDIDRQMVDAADIFKNVKDLHEIRTDYLTDDQRKVAEELWGINIEQQFESFWNHYRQDNGENVVFDGFRSLSELLYPIYTRFNELLAERGLVTRGRIARNAADRIADAIDTPGLLPDRLCFVGFGVLSKSDKLIFDALHKSRRADFFWDKPDMLYRDMPLVGQNNPTALSKYIGRMTKRYPMPAGYKLPQMSPSPSVEIISVPSNTMQTKIAGNILEALRKNGAINATRADNTAIVMPDASLLVSMLHSLPPYLNKVNVTMGLPVRNTPFATLLSLIITAHMSCRHDGDDVVFLTENVARILTHPSMNVIAADESRKLRAALQNKSRYVTSYNTIVRYAPSLAFIFKPVEAADTARAAEQYLVGLIDGMTELINRNTTADSKARDSHELRSLDVLRGAVTKIVDLLCRHREVTPELDTGSMTFFRMVEKILNREVMNLSGSPLRGVQIMGALETRSLDFDNVVMLSMNEKTFPPKNYVRSLVPSALRYAYGMTTVEEREMEYSWIFANLLSRSARVYLLYNAAADELGTGGMSRYLYQCQHIFTGLDAKRVTIFPKGTVNDNMSIVIKKNERVKAELRRMLAGGDLNLSASALKNYMKCPLKFYLSNVRKIYESKEPTPSIDAASQGTIAHAVLETLFNTYVVGRNNGIVDASLNIPVAAIADEVARQFDEKYYFGRFGGKIELMPGEARMISGVLTKKIDEIIRLEKARGPFRFVGAEVTPLSDGHPSKSFDWEICPGLKIRFTYSIDRMDRLDDGTLRFIDYKTGSDNLDGGTLEDIFHLTGTSDKNNDAIFQLLTYAHAYNDFTGANRPVAIELTKIFDPAGSIGAPLRLKVEDLHNKQPITSHLDDIVADFRPMLEDTVRKIFDDDTPFGQAEDVEACRYCQFLNVCHRIVPEPRN